MDRTPFPQARIDQIVAEGMALVREGEERMAHERARGWRCTCCNILMKTPSPNGECVDCQRL